MESTFDDFTSAVEPQHKVFIKAAHESLLSNGYKMKIEDKAAGLFVSYSHSKTKRSVLNLFFRKKGLMARLYPDDISGYIDLLNDLTESMIKEIDRSAPCKRLINPGDCNPRCITGYDFIIGGKRYQKSRYMCFQFAVTAENKNILTEWIEKANDRRNNA